MTHGPQLTTLKPNGFRRSLKDLPLDPSASSPGPSTPSSPSVPKTRRDAALDGLRGLAILLVFIFHYGGGLQSTKPAQRLAGYFTQFSWCGVVLFFALSGFLITGSLWETNHTLHRLRNFYARRALRILPLYFLALLATAIAALLTRRPPRATPARCWSSSSSCRTFPTSPATRSQTPSPLPLYHFWTLAVEEQFYLIWPIVMFLAHSRRHALRLSLWFFGICELLPLLRLHPFPLRRRRHPPLVRLLPAHPGRRPRPRLRPLPRHGQSRQPHRPQARHPPPDPQVRPARLLHRPRHLSLVSIVCGTFYITYPVQFWLGLPALSIAAAATIPLVLRTGLPRKIFSFAPLGLLGRISYGFYVFHILLEPFYDRLGATLAHTSTGDYYHIVRAILAFVLTLIVSLLSFYLFEMPILSLKRFFPVNASLPWGEPISETPRSRHRTSHSVPKGA